MKINIRWPFQKETRQTFYPSEFPFRQSEQILAVDSYFESHPVMRIVVNLYRDSANLYDLVIKDKEGKKIDHYLLDIFRQPCEWMSKSQFIALMTRNVLIGGQQNSIIEYDSKGRITALKPFLYSKACFAYAKPGTNLSDPAQIKDYYFQGVSGKYNKDEILQLRDLSFGNQSDLLNGYSRLNRLDSALQAGIAMQETIKEACSNSLISPDIFTGPPTTGKDKKESFIQKVDAFWRQNIGYRKRSLWLPKQVEKIKNQNDSISPLLKEIKKISDEDIAASFGVNWLLLHAGGPQSSIKEIMRFFRQQIIESWLKNIGNQMTNQLLTEAEKRMGLKIGFASGIMSSMDRRETGQYLKALYDNKILTKNETRDLIGFAPCEGGDSFKEEDSKEDKLLKQIKEMQNDDNTSP